MPYAKGDQFRWMGATVTIKRVARDQAWADIACKSGYARWTKRASLPLPDDAVRLKGETNA